MTLDTWVRRHTVTQARTLFGGRQRLPISLCVYMWWNVTLRSADVQRIREERLQLHSTISWTKYTESVFSGAFLSASGQTMFLRSFICSASMCDQISEHCCVHLGQNSCVMWFALPRAWEWLWCRQGRWVRGERRRWANVWSGSGRPGLHTPTSPKRRTLDTLIS